MNILVANLGSTSFKYRLFDMADERVLARGGVERIGGSQPSPCFVEWGGRREETTTSAKDHGVAVRLCLSQLADLRILTSPSDLAAIGFKAVHAEGLSGVHRVDERVLAAMEAYNDVAPAHNPPYVNAMRLLTRELPESPLVAAFETSFHGTMPRAQRYYGVPLECAEFGIQRHGFHGASHRYIAERTGELLGNSNARIISCHLGGSSSLCAIAGGKSQATSMGMSPQSGLPQNNRVGDFDVFALPALMRRTGMTLEQVLDILARGSGLAGLSGGRTDLRDIESAAAIGDRRARLALEVFAASIRHYLGAYLLLLNGADTIVFTGGIGENSPRLREMVCANLDWFGIALDPTRNQTAKGEARLDASGSRVQLWIMPTNEELIVARQVREFLSSTGEVRETAERASETLG